MKKRLLLNILFSIVVVVSLHITLQSVGQGIIIPVGSYFSIPSGDYVRMTGADTLTIQSSATGTGSLICNGTITGPSKVERYMTGAKWHIVTPPVSGQSFTSFILNAANNIPSLSGTNPLQYGVMDYDEATDKWSTTFTADKSGNFSVMKGYSVRNRADGKIVFKGNLTTGNQSSTLTRGKYGWTCLGNPYSSIITAKGAGGLLASNSASLDPLFAGLYLWDEQANYNNSGLKKDYRVICNTPYSFPFNIVEESQQYIAAGQGFFVKSKTGGGTFSFTPSMQMHQSGSYFKAVQANWPAIRITANGNNATTSTVIAFNSEMTRGLDPTYDVGMLKGNPDFSVFSRMNASDGTDFAVQARPESSLDADTIAIGIDCKTASAVTFKIEKAFFPEDCDIVFEDRQNRTFTELSESDELNYTTNVIANNKGTGRFFLHINNKSTNINAIPEHKFNTYSSSNRIHVSGILSEIKDIAIYYIDGKLAELNKQNSNLLFSSKELPRGIYVVKISGTKFTKSYRVLVD